MKEKILTVPTSEFRFDFYRGSGAGGQKRNKTASACRCVHTLSGAVGQSQDERSQIQNKRRAFCRCVESKKFQLWLRMEVAAKLKGFCDFESKIDDMVREENLKIEFYDPEN